MKLSLKRDTLRRAVLVMLAAAAAATVVKGRERPTIELVEAKAPRAEAPAQADLDIGRLLRSEGVPAAQSDPFAARDFAAKPQNAPRRSSTEGRASAKAREAPPLPFAYFGRLTQGGETETFVMRGDELISIAQGLRIDAEYRVDSISDSAIRFTYLPLNASQALELQNDG
jgi:hypothetical protein